MDAGDGEGASEDATAPSVPATFAVPLVELAGGASGSVASTGEAWTTWRYGAGAKGPVDETTTRLQVSGSGRSLDGLIVGFSVGQLVPALATGRVAATTSLAAAWARRDRAAVPDIEWERGTMKTLPSLERHSNGVQGTPVAPSPGRAARAGLTILAIEETSHSAERRGGVIVEVTHYRLHGTLDVTLPCKRSVPSLRASCRPEAIRGTF
ncbi:MAG TPA: hypothetical protein VHV30_14945 [Polyangiaceae bacterium]|nr:hypothetical protein [Polyangiaceae bacterium]